MNPPFTNRSKMGEKFPEGIQRALRKRTDSLEERLIEADPELKNFASRNTVRPCFVTLADRCLPIDAGTLTMINPTIALSGPSGLNERRILAQRYHIHTVLTCHQPGNINMSQETSINESIIVMRRCKGTKPPTRFINLDRLPADAGETDEMFKALAQCQTEVIPEGWGEVSHWPAERMDAGDWTAAIWRSPALAQAAWSFKSAEDLIALHQQGIFPID